MSCAVLKQAVGESSCGRTHIQADVACYIHVPVQECSLKFQSAATYIYEIVSKQANHAIGRNLRARLLDLLLVDEYFAGENQRVRPFICTLSIADDLPF